MGTTGIGVVNFYEVGQCMLRLQVKASSIINVTSGVP